MSKERSMGHMGTGMRRLHDTTTKSSSEKKGVSALPSGPTFRPLARVMRTSWPFLNLRLVRACAKDRMVSWYLCPWISPTATSFSLMSASSCVNSRASVKCLTFM